MNPTDVTPFLAGCHPDPSICRVGEEYFVVTSSFAFAPGLPVHRSTDLVDWRLAGHVLPDPDAVGLRGLNASDGVWAATIRHHDGLFFVVFTVAENRRGRGTYVSTASEAAGPWSPPVLLEGEGIDPSLFFDDDGRAWFTAARDAIAPDARGPGEIWMREFDPRARRLVGPEHILWHGAVTGAWVEAPHLFRVGDGYCLIAAEGGTERNHAVTAASADAITGPYRTDPRSPLLTHRHLPADAAVQNLGHADLTRAADGGWVGVALGVRPVDGVHVLGRESFLLRATEEPQGLVLALASASAMPGAPASERDWLSFHTPAAHRWDHGSLLLDPHPAGLTDTAGAAVLGVRQDTHRMRFGARIEAPERAGAERWIVAMQGQERVFGIVAYVSEDGPRLDAVLVERGRRIRLGTQRLTGEATVEISSDGRQYIAAAVTASGRRVLATIAARELSTEVAGGFLGVLLAAAHVAPVDEPAARFGEVSYVPDPSAAVRPSSAAEPAPVG